MIHSSTLSYPYLSSWNGSKPRQNGKTRTFLAALGFDVDPCPWFCRDGELLVWTINSTETATQPCPMHGGSE